VFFGISGFEFVILAVLALLVFGPERLPGLAADAARILRQLRRMAQEARDEVSGALPDLEELGLKDLQDLDPRRYVRRQLLEERDDLDAALEERPPARRANGTATPNVSPPVADPPAAAAGTPPPWDADAT